jgi:branched-chain amino acid transport system substrate-binding protein
MSIVKKGMNRRHFLTTAAATSLVMTAPMHFVRGAWAQTEKLGNFPVTTPTVKFGFTVPLTGSYADEGADELKACRLAIQHLNEGGGMLATMKPLSLKGNGVLGKKVEGVEGDTRTNPDAARTLAQRMIERDGIITWTGGSSSAEAIAMQYLAQEKNVIMMVGLSHSNDTTGKDKRRYGFRHFFNAYISGQILGPLLAKEYGKERRAFHLTADYTWGHTQYESMKISTEKQGWKTVNNIMTPLGATDYSQYLTAVLNTDADVLVLNHYGNDMVNSLTQAVQFGVRDLQRNGKQVEIVVPLYSELMARGAGAKNIQGIFGTANWNFRADDAGSKAFVQSFQDAYGFPPSQAAQTVYAQLLIYANAVERAGTFYPPEVIKAIEDFEFEGMGPGGPGLYRGADHQAFHDVFVVRGKKVTGAAADPYDLLDIVQQVPGEQTVYDPAVVGAGDLGPYKTGA